jgi:general secretion pathway protein K
MTNQPNVAPRQRGVALITVLLVVALVAVIAVSMGGRLQGQIARVGAAEQSEQAYWHWLSAEALVRQVLLAEIEADDYIHLGQNWATRQGPFPVEGGLIAGSVKDLRSCFNLNGVSAADGQSEAQYLALLQALEFDEYTSRQLSATLIDWMDSDSELMNNYGAEDPDYESLARPYQAANAPLSHISELRQIRGYTQSVYEKLRPYVCAIPGNTELRLNINTIDEAQPELLSALYMGSLDLGAARSILESRPAQGYAETSEVTALPELQAIKVEDEEQVPGGSALQTSSEYFELRAAIQYGEVEFFAVSILQIANGEARVLHRSRRGHDWND